MHDKLPEPDILTRKEKHIGLALDDTKRHIRASHGLDSFDFVHCALPEMRLQDVSLETSFLGKDLRAPFLIGSMTGGPEKARQINRHLAEAAQVLGVGMGVGSQRVALEQAGTAGLDQTLRKYAPDILLISNIGGAQLARPDGLDLARRAIEQIDADAIFIHLNPLQEALQPDGDTDWCGVLDGIGKLCSSLGKPVLVKEIGCGTSADTAKRLQEAGVTAIDVAGAGGTSWAWIESQRHDPEEARFLADTFGNWGIPTATALKAVREACPRLPLIGSGGIRNGVEAAKAIHLGADIVSIAGGVLPAALESTEAVIRYFEAVIAQLRITCFVTGSAKVADLRQVETFARPKF